MDFNGWLRLAWPTLMAGGLIIIVILMLRWLILHIASRHVDPDDLQGARKVASSIVFGLCMLVTIIVGINVAGMTATNVVPRRDVDPSRVLDSTQQYQNERK